MDTKLKNVKYSLWVRVLVLVVAFIGILLCYLGTIKFDDFKVAVQAQDYKESPSFRESFSNVCSNISNVFLNFKSEESIKDGSAFSNDDITAYQDQLESEKQSLIADENSTYYYLVSSVNSNDTDELNRLKVERDSKINKIVDDYKTKIQNAKPYLIEKTLKEFAELKSMLPTKDYVYSVFINGIFTSGINQNEDAFEKLPYYTEKIDNIDGQKVIYVGILKASYDRDKADFDERYKNGMNGLMMFIIGFILVLFSLVWFAFTAGRNRTNDAVNLNLLDKTYIDVAAFIAFSFIALSVMLLYAIFSNGKQFYYLFGFELFITSYLIIALFIVMLSKRLKRGEVLKHTLIFVILRFCYRSVKKIAVVIPKKTDYVKYLMALLTYAATVCLATTVSFKAIIGTGSGTIAWLCIILVGIFTIAGVYYIKKKQFAVEVLSDNIKIIRNGDLNHIIPVTGVVSIDSIGEDVNNISDGLKNAVDNAVSSQKMKVELITNVSHDLKTPLTSIISYVDLLSKEDFNSEIANKYIDILKYKSDRLKNLIDDLFEISKAESGNIAVNLERLSLNDLLTQSLAEFDEKYLLMNLKVLVSGNKEKVFILADSGKLGRVFSNILGNIANYTVSNSRVYIDILPDADFVKVIFKNISNYEMNFDVAEITERFKRGDEARTTEGTGLGLAIVNSFMELQGGKCEIMIDGDLFKVVLLIPSDSEL